MKLLEGDELIYKAKLLAHFVNVLSDIAGGVEYIHGTVFAFVEASVTIGNTFLESFPVSRKVIFRIPLHGFL